MPNIYYIVQKRESLNNAASKAPDDIEELCRRRNYCRYEVDRFPVESGFLYQKLWLLIKCNLQWLGLYRKIKEGDVVFCQHPTYGIRIAMNWIRRFQNQKRCRFIVLIHDLNILRGHIAGKPVGNKKTDELMDTALLKCFDIVICHNESMIEYLCANGFDKNKLVNLTIFDYLTSFDCKEHERTLSNEVIIAGNLNRGKSSYIYGISDKGHNLSLRLNLFGSNHSEKDLKSNMKWFGSFSPDELPSKLNGSFGLVWDGPSANTCEGSVGNYLRFNDPHKTSLYLVSGVPVIIWDKAALAGFIMNNKLGLTVKSLYELERRIRSITDEEYKEMRENTLRIAEDLKNGLFFYRAFDEALDRIMKKE